LINALGYSGGGTYTGCGICQAQYLFTQRRSDRVSVPKVVIVITDGCSNVDPCGRTADCSGGNCTFSTAIANANANVFPN